MFMQLSFIFVIVATAWSFVQPPMASTQADEPITDPVAYTIYATLLPERWRKLSNGPMLLTMDTYVPSGCSTIGVSRGDSEWTEAEDDFRQANVRVRTLQALL